MVGLDNVNDYYDVELKYGRLRERGIRYSITNPQAYVESNIDGFFNVLECCRRNKAEHLVYASSSSVYGLNGKVLF